MPPTTTTSTQPLQPRDAATLYFAYGSNLDADQMQRRCPHAVPLGPAFLPGHCLSFPVTSRGDWLGGVASVELFELFASPPFASEPRAHGQYTPSPNPHPIPGVWGALYRVTDADLDALDDYEAVAEGMYTRECVAVLTPHQPDPLDVLTYRALRNYNPPAPPSRRYRQTIADGAQAFGLPADYVAALRALPTLD